MGVPVRTKIPFEFQTKNDFPAKLAGWIGHVFYDLLPGHGYEIREEQIFTAFQLADAVCKGKVHFAEAGLGTGKTFAYLLAAIPYARLTGKPVVIACASTALQEQLAGPKGDARTLSRLLNLDLDVRLAKDPRQYICEVRVDRLAEPFSGKAGPALQDAARRAGASLRGERSEMPDVPDRIWKMLAWDETMSCEICSSRGFCKLVRAREHYRPARDLIVGDHGIFFDDLWTRDDRIADGKLPLLPAYSAVILDEGHKVMLPAAMRAGHRIVREDIGEMLSSLEQIQGARTSLISVAFAAGSVLTGFFKKLYHSVSRDERTDRLAVQIDDELLGAAEILGRALEALLRELQYEQELYLESLATTQLQACEVRIERATAALDRFCRNRGADAIVWVSRSDGSFWVVPRDLSGLLEKRLFAGNIPVVFSSATLSTGGDFNYFKRALGLKKVSSSSVAGAFDYEKQVLLYLPRRFPAQDKEARFSLALKRLVALLRLSGGRALVLTNYPSDVQKIRKGLKNHRFPFELLWEDKAERGYLVERFREEVPSVLVGAGFWEGIDVPGEALSLLVIWGLPFPPPDPLIEARRLEVAEQGLDPVTGVEYPEMALRLKQGCGRLIRKRDERGVIAILEPLRGMPWERVALEALPPGSKAVASMAPLSSFLGQKTALAGREDLPQATGSPEQ